MTDSIISKVLEINNCNKEDLLKAIYKPEFWEAINPCKEMEAKFTAPNVLHTAIMDEINVVKVPIKMEGELVFQDKGEEEDKGRLIELNVRNNNDVKELEARLRIKSLSPIKSKIGVFVQSLVLNSDFLNLIGGTSELILRTKITDMVRNLEKLCKTRGLKEFL